MMPQEKALTFFLAYEGPTEGADRARTQDSANHWPKRSGLRGSVRGGCHSIGTGSHTEVEIYKKKLEQSAEGRLLKPSRGNLRTRTQDQKMVKKHQGGAALSDQGRDEERHQATTNSGKNARAHFLGGGGGGLGGGGVLGWGGGGGGGGGWGGGGGGGHIYASAF